MIGGYTLLRSKIRGKLINDKKKSAFNKKCDIIRSRKINNC